MLAELNPNLHYGEICQLLIQAERQAGPLTEERAA